MVIAGNITISSRPREDDLSTGVICLSCLQECDEKGIDDSFSDGFGNVTCWDVGSGCCEAETAEGKIFLDRCRVHIARKDHVRNGKVVVPKGAKYMVTIRKGYYIEDGEHKGIYEYRKKVLRLPDPPYETKIIKS